MRFLLVVDDDVTEADLLNQLSQKGKAGRLSRKMISRNGTVAKSSQKDLKKNMSVSSAVTTSPSSFGKSSNRNSPSLSLSSTSFTCKTGILRKINGGGNKVIAVSSDSSSDEDIPQKKIDGKMVELETRSCDFKVHTKRKRKKSCEILKETLKRKKLGVDYEVRNKSSWDEVDEIEIQECVSPDSMSAEEESDMNKGNRDVSSHSSSDLSRCSGEEDTHIQTLSLIGSGSLSSHKTGTRTVMQSPQTKEELGVSRRNSGSQKECHIKNLNKICAVCGRNIVTVRNEGNRNKMMSMLQTRLDDFWTNSAQSTCETCSKTTFATNQNGEQGTTSGAVSLQKRAKFKSLTGATGSPYRKRKSDSPHWKFECAVQEQVNSKQDHARGKGSKSIYLSDRNKEEFLKDVSSSDHRLDDSFSISNLFDNPTNWDDGIAGDGGETQPNLVTQDLLIARPPVTALPKPNEIFVVPDWLYVALDCEMVGTGPKGRHSVLARCSVVNYEGTVLYDKYIRPNETITDYRTPWSGIRPAHMKKAVPIDIAVADIKNILSHKIVIGHSVYNDFRALGMTPDHHFVRDTAQCPQLVRMAGLQGQGNSLKKLSQALLDRKIQVGRQGHCSVEDARATLDLFKLIRPTWEPELYRKWAKKELNLYRKFDTLVREAAVQGGANAIEDFLHDRFWPIDEADQL